MKCNGKRSLKCIWNYFLDFIILYHWSIFPSSLSLQALLQVSLRVQEPFFTLYLFLNEEKCIKLCQKCHYVSIHCYHIDLHNSCHKWDIVTFGTIQLFMYPLYFSCKTASFFYTLNQEHVRPFYQIKSPCSKHIHTRLDSWLSTAMYGTFWNEYVQLP